MRQRASEDEMGLTDDIVKRLDDGLYDDEQLHLTERLAGAWVTQREVGRQTFNRAVQVLTPHQRDKLTHVIADKLVVDIWSDGCAASRSLRRCSSAP